MNGNSLIFDEAAAPIFQSGVKRVRPSAPKTASPKSDKKSDKKTKKNGKDEKPQSDLAQRAEKLAEDPYMTPSEMRNMDGGSKEKEQKTEGGESESSEQQEDDPKKELNTIVSRAAKTLLRAKAIFPFDLFPNTVTIDANKVDVILKTFFFSETVTSILLKEIMDVRVETALFFGKLIIDYGPHPLKVKTVYVPNLKRHDAIKAKEIIEGMLVLYRGENIDTAKLKPDETMAEVREIGHVEGER